MVIPGPKKEWKPSDPKDFVRFVMGRSHLNIIRPEKIWIVWKLKHRITIINDKKIALLCIVLVPICRSHSISPTFFPLLT